ncbi:MAG: glycosyltransferase family 2 protein [Lachnospiraceae bacterium]|nr:glycosyltransferase family 2 protein [Lachnospiraceae bacterium]
MSKISIIVPVYYSSDTLMLLYQDMKEKILGRLGDYEIVFVDDGSGDRSWDIMQEIKAMDDRVVLVRLSRNFGEHAALLAGLSCCTGDCAVTKQADLQEDSELILELYESWKKGNKVVLAVREERDDKLIYKWFANLYYVIVRKLIMPDMPKGGFDCYLLDRKAIDVLLMLDERNSSLSLQVLWMGFQTDKVYFHRKAREVGESRWTMSKKIKLIVDSMMSFSYFPIRFMTVLGGLVSLFAFLMGIFIVSSKLIVGEPVLGWTSLMAVLLFSTGLILLMLGVLGEYIWRALDASRNRPPYLIDTIEKNKKEDGSINI